MLVSCVVIERADLFYSHASTRDHGVMHNIIRSGNSGHGSLKITMTGKPNSSAEPANEFKGTAVLPHVKGLSEQLRRCLQQQGVRVIFKSETMLRSQLIRPKDAVDPAKQDGVVYRIPYECGEVSIGDTGRPMQDRIKEHDRDIRLARAETYAV
ncbi:unnamed protein product [Pocillopora meandrina]|uniref:Uncharacterized protein n=1 Tax=Pocillopora meandrina TaxID=46732 RepID=A0AAU9X0T4_9CNID|nr:unnamed protein product [Pocillopora meandrina]